MWGGFRGFLDLLEQRGELRRIEKEVSPVHEIAAYIRKTSDLQGPAFLFERVKGFPGWRAAGGLFATHSRIGLILGTEPRGILHEYGRGVQHPIPPRVVEDGPCKEVVWKGDDADLRKIPVPVHSERDPGPFIIAGVQVAKDPQTGVRGLGICRLQVKGKDKLGFWAPGEKRLGRAFLKSEEAGKPLEIATAIGVDPRIILASQAKVPHSEEKYDIAGGFMEQPCELVRCETIDVEVPAHSEVVIEGEILPGIREPEGPFGEVTGCYSGGKTAPVIKVKAVTMRSDPIYLTTLAGMPVTENNLLAWPSVMEGAYRQASVACPEVKAVNVTGNGYYTVLVSIRKRMEKEPYNVISSVLSLYATKFCYVFDDDIDIFDPRDVQWALETRVQPVEDVHIFPVMVGAPLDPSAPLERHTSKMGMDATIPLGAPREKFERVRVPGVEKVAW